MQQGELEGWTGFSQFYLKDKKCPHCKKFVDIWRSGKKLIGKTEDKIKCPNCSKFIYLRFDLFHSPVESYPTPAPSRDFYGQIGAAVTLCSGCNTVQRIPLGEQPMETCSQESNFFYHCGGWFFTVEDSNGFFLRPYCENCINEEKYKYNIGLETRTRKPPSEVNIKRKEWDKKYQEAKDLLQKEKTQKGLDILRSIINEVRMYDPYFNSAIKRAVSSGTIYQHYHSIVSLEKRESEQRRDIKIEYKADNTLSNKTKAYLFAIGIFFILEYWLFAIQSGWFIVVFLVAFFALPSNIRGFLFWTGILLALEYWLLSSNHYIWGGLAFLIGAGGLYYLIEDDEELRDFFRKILYKILS